MSFLVKILFTSSFYGILGYLISITLVVFNKYVSIVLSNQMQNSEHLSLIGIITYIISNRLTENDLIFSLFGFVFMFSLGLLRGFQKRTGAY